MTSDAKEGQGLHKPCGSHGGQPSDGAQRLQKQARQGEYRLQAAPEAEAIRQATPYTLGAITTGDGCDGLPRLPDLPPNRLQMRLQATCLQNPMKEALRNSLLRKALQMGGARLELATSTV